MLKFIWSIWLDQTKQIHQRSQIDQTDEIDPKSFPAAC